MIFNSFSNIEAYESSFDYLDAKLIQLSKGAFESCSQTFIHDKLTLDRRLTTASHLHHCTVKKGTVNFVFPNLSPNLTINGLNIGQKNQITVTGGEEIAALVRGELDITTVSLQADELLLYLPKGYLQQERINGEMLRKTIFCPASKSALHLLINQYLNYLKVNKTISKQYINDLVDTIFFQIQLYLESFRHDYNDRKVTLSSQELNRIIEFVARCDVLSLKDLQSVCLCSPRSLNNIISKYFGCTPQQLISTARLNQINRYLGCDSDEKKTIKHISEKFGIHSQYRLSKAYQSLFGVSIQQSLIDRRSP